MIYIRNQHNCDTATVLQRHNVIAWQERKQRNCQSQAVTETNKK